MPSSQFVRSTRSPADFIQVLIESEALATNFAVLVKIIVIPKWSNRFRLIAIVKMKKLMRQNFGGKHEKH